MHEDELATTPSLGGALLLLAIAVLLALAALYEVETKVVGFLLPG
jgi:hypothetical protein